MQIVKLLMLKHVCSNIAVSAWNVKGNINQQSYGHHHSNYESQDLDKK